MIIKRDHPKYEVIIEPKDIMSNGQKYGKKNKFTKQPFKFDYTNYIEEGLTKDDVLDIIKNIFDVKPEIVEKAWEA